MASNSANWIGGVPAGGDHVVFGSTTPTKTCTWDLSVTLSSVDFSGTFSSSVVLTSNLLVSSSVASAGTASAVIDLQGKKLSVGTNLIADGLDFTSTVAGSSVVFEGASAGAVSKTGGVLHFENFVSSKAVGSTETVNANLIVGGGLSVLEGALFLNGVQLNLTGDIFLGGFLAMQTSTVALAGSAPQSFSGGPGSGGGPGGSASSIGALFVQNASTVTLPGITVGVLVDTTPSSTLTFLSGNTFQIGTMTVAGGGSSSRVQLYTDSAGSTALLDAGSASVDYAFVRDLDASGGADPLATHTIDGGNNANWTILAAGGRLAWNGAGANALASNGANWVGGVAPGAQDFVTLGAAGAAKPCTWDLAVQVASFSVSATYASALTLSTDLQSAFGVSLSGAGGASVDLAGHAIRDEGGWSADSISVAGVAGSSVSFEGVDSANLSSTNGGSLTFPGLSIDKAGAAAVTAQAAVSVSRDFLVLAGTYSAGGFLQEIGGVLRVSGGYLDVSGSTVALDGSGTQAALFSSSILASPVAALYAQSPGTTTLSGWTADLFVATQPSSGLVFFTQDSTMTVGAFRVSGQSLSTRLMMSGPGSLRVTGGSDVQFAAISGLEASSGLTIPALYSLDGGGNGNWSISSIGGAQREWSYSGPSANASNAANWAGGVAPSTSDFVLFGGLTPSAPCTWDLPMQFSSFTITGAYASAVTLSTNLSVANGIRLDAAAGTLDPAGLAILDEGDWTALNGSLSGGVAASSVVFAGGSAATVAASGPGPLAFGNLLFQKASTGTATLASDLRLSGSLEVDGGAVAAGAHLLGLDGNLTVGGGSMDAALSTFVFSGAAPQRLNGGAGGSLSTVAAIYAQNPTTTTIGGVSAGVFVATTPSQTVLFDSPGGSTATFASFTANGQAAGTRAILAGLGPQTPLAVTGSASLEFIEAKDLYASAGIVLNAIHSLDGGGNANWNISNVGGATAVWDHLGGDSLASNSANWAGGLAPSDGDFVLFGATTPSAPCTWDLAAAVSSFSVSGSYAGTITLSSNLSVTGAGVRLDAPAATLDLNGRAVLLSGDWTAGGTALTSSIAGSSVVFSGPGDSLIAGLASAVPSFTTLISSKDAGARLIPQADIAVSGLFEILSGTFSAPSRTVNLSGNLGLNGGYLDVRSSTFALVGTAAQTIAGNGQGHASSFAGLDIQTDQIVTIPQVSADILVATRPSARVYLNTQTGPIVLQALKIDGGSSGTKVLISSASAGVAAQLTIQSTASVRYADAVGIDASGGLGVTAADSTDGGGNSNWTFVTSNIGIQNAAFTGRSTSGALVSWSTTFGGGQSYTASISTDSFATLVASSATLNAFAGFAGLTPNTLYQGRVSTDPAGPYTDAGSTTTMSLAPTGPAVYAAFASSATLTWGTAGNPAGTVFTAAASADLFATIAASSSVTVGSATISGLSGDTTYTLKVGALNIAPDLPQYSATVTTVTLAFPPAAGAAPTAGAGSIVASWSADGNGSGTTYDSEISTDSFATLVDSTRTTALSASYAGLAPDTTYQLRVRTVARDGTLSPYAALASATTLLPIPGAAAAPFSGLGQSSVTVAWTTSGPGLTYAAELSTDSFATLVFSSATAALSAQFGTGGAGAPLSPNATYYARVKAKSAGNESQYLVLGSTITAPAAPTGAAPLDLRASSGTWSWGSGGNSAGTTYLLQLSTDSFATFVQTGQAAATQAGFTGLTPNTAYQFRVAARGGDGSQTAFAAASSSYTWPSAPSPSGSSLFVSSASLTWTDGDPAPLSYSAEASTDSFATLSIVNATSNLFADLLGLVPNTTYEFRVRAIGASGTSVASVSATAMTGTFSPTLSSFTATATGTVTAAWLAGGNPSGVTYQADLSTDSFATIVASSATAATSVSFAGLQADTTHELRVRSRNDAGLAAPYDAVATTVTAPDVPTALPLSVAGATEAAVNWGPGGNGAGTVYEAQATTGTFPALSASTRTAALTFDFTGLTVNTTYSFQVRAVGRGGRLSSFLSLGTTRTLLLAPGAPAQPVTAVGVSSVSVSWTDGGNGAGMLYDADLSTDNFASVSLTSATRNLSAAFGTGGLGPALASNATFYFRVRADGGVALSAYVGLGSTATFAAAPAAPAAVPGSTTTAGMSWSSAGNAATTVYEVQLSTDGFADLLASTTTSASSALFSGLASNATADLRVRALGIEGPTAFVSVSTWTVAADPGAPSAFAFDSITVPMTWGAPNAPGSAYQAVLSTAPPLIWASTVVYTGSVTQYGLLANVTYYSEVRALYPDGTGGPFVTGSTVTTPAQAPTSFTDVQVNITSATYVWFIGDNGPTTYSIEVSTMATFVPLWSTQSVDASSAAGAVAYMTGLQPNTTQNMRIRALGWTGPTGYSVSSPPATNPQAPGSAQPVFVGTGSIVAAWTDGGNGEGTVFEARISTDGFATTNDAVRTTTTTMGFGGLTPNTNYDFGVRVVGRYSNTAFVSLPSTSTLPTPPGAPAAPFGTVGVTSVTVSWTSGGNLAGTVYRADASTDSFATLVVSSLTASLSAIFGTTGRGVLTPDTTYQFRVSATHGGSSSLETVLGSTATLSAAPVAPAASAASTDSISVLWSPNGNPSDAVYEIQASTDSFATVSASSRAAATSVVLSGLSANTTYFARVRGLGRAGTPSSFVSAPATATCAAPPASLVWAFDATSATLTWSSAGNSTMTVYEAQSSTDSFATASAVAIGTGTTASFSGLIPNTTYFLRARALGLDGASAFTASAASATNAAAPLSPLAAALGVSSASMTWSANGNSTGTVYGAEISTDSFATVSQTSVTANLFAAYSGLEANTTYYQRVRALGVSGAASAYAVAAATATPAAAPAPGSFTAVVSSGLSVAWGSGGNRAGTIYEAQISTDAFGTLVASSVTAALSASFSGLAAGTTYGLQVRAIANDGSATAFTDLGSTQTMLGAPGAAAVPFSGVATTALTAAWTSGGSPGGTTFVAEISTDAFATVVQASTTFNLAASFSGLTPDTTYAARVHAQAGPISSDPLSVGTTATLAMDPAAPTAVFASTEALRWTWSPNGNPPDTQYLAEASSDAFAGVAASGSVAATTAAVSGLIPDTAYSFRVRAVGRGGTINPFVVGGATATYAVAPAAASAGYALTTATLTWAASGNPASTSYSAEVSTDSFATLVLSNLAAGTTAPFSGLIPNTTYELRVRAAGVNGAPTAYAVAATSATRADAPSGAASALLGVSAASVTWSPGGNPPGTVYAAEISTDAAFASLVQSSATANLAAAFSGLEGNATYYQRVRAVQWNGGVTAYAAAPATVTAAAAPGSAPTGTVSSGSVVAAWTAGGNSAGTLFEARISTDGFATYNDAVLGAATQAGFGGLTPNTTYAFQVRTIARDGTPTAFTALPSTTTYLIPPGAAASTFPAVGLSSVAVAWSSGGNAPGTFYHAELSTDAFTTLVASSDTAALSAVFGTGGQGAPLNPDATYQARVRTVGGGNESYFLALGSTGTLAADPAAPAVTASSTGSLTMSWGAGGNPTDTVYRSELSSDSFSGTLAALTQTGLSASFSGLTPDTTYQLRVRAISRAGAATAYGAMLSTTTPAAVPAAPAVAFGQTTALLSWTAAGNPLTTPYETQMSTDSFATLLSSAAGTALSRFYSSLTPNTTYFLRVRALGVSGPSAFASAAAGATSPLPPVTPAASAAAAAATISWGSGGNSAGTSYGAEVSSDSFATISASSATANLFATFASLESNATYFLRVRTLGWSAVSGYSATVTTTTPVAVPASAPPVAIGTDTVTAAWGTGGNASGTIYDAEVSTDAFGSVNASSRTTALLAEFDGLIANTTYDFRVRAIGRDGTASAYASLPSTMTLILPPGAAAVPFAAVGISSLSVSWTPGLNGPGAVYRVQLSTDGFSTVSIGSDTANLSVLFGTGGEGAPLPVNTLYAARVQSVNNGNASAFLPVGSTSTYAVTPSGTAVAAISSQTVTLDWSPAGNPEPGTSYQVQSDASPAFPSPRTITVSTSGATVASLAMGGTYYFRVRAISAAGAPTGYDAAVSTATLPAAPARAASPAAFTLGLSSISWSWAGSPDAVSYEVYGDTLSTLLLSTQTGTAFVQTGLGPNASSYLMIVAVNANGEGPRSVPGLGWTLANPPTGTSFPGVFATSATVSWSLNGNPPYTAVEVQRSPTGAIYSTIATGVSGSSYTDTGLLGCTPYYYRVRNLNGNGAPTAWDAAISFTTGVSTPLAPSGLSASPLTGNRISFSWSPSPTTDIAAYKLYSDGGTGTVNFASSFAYFTSTETAFVSPPQASSASYAFVLRAINRCGTEEANTTTRASSPAEAAPAAVSAVVSSPPGGLRVDGNRLTVAASPASGALTDFSSVRFQYRASGVSAWTDIPAAAAAHPNPATAAPYYTQWDVTVLAAGPYEVRAIAYDLSSSSDPAPAATTIIVDPATPDLSETDIGGGRSRRDQKVYSSIDNSVFVGGLSAGDPLARLVLPAGALGDESATLSLISDPDLTGVSTTVAGAFAAGLFARVTLSNGQSSLNGRTALLTLSYPDANNDGVVDGTGGLVASNLRFYSYDSVSGLWRQDLSTSFDPAARTITGGTPHFTLFGVFTAVAAVTNLDAVRAYPVPFKPNGKNPDEGRPYAAGIPGTGIFFDNLPTNATVRIYTVDGRLVADLVAAGGTSIQWNAKNGAGRDVATGGYFAVISVPGLRSTVRKLSIIR